jgi:hypothetical protein
MSLKANVYKPPLFPHQDYEDRIVAFVDVLGFNDLVDSSKDDVKALRNITSALSTLYEWIWQWEADGTDSSFAFTQFSDSVVLSALADTQDSFEMLLQLMLGIVDIAYSNGIIVRGGIARGKLIHDREMVVGPAMVDAYLLESTIAKYPRIVISEELKNEFEVNLQEYVDSQPNLSEIPGFNKIFKQDDVDGLWYMDYVDPDEAFVIKHSKEDYLDSLKDIVRKGLTNVNPKIRLKYEWLEQKLAAI